MPLVSDHPVWLALVVAYLLVVATAGYAVLAAVSRPGVRHWTELLGLSFAAGSAAVAWILFALSVVGAKPSRGVLAGIGLAAAAGLSVLVYRGRLLTGSVPAPRRRRPDPTMLLGGLAAVTVGFAVANVFAGATSPWLADIDAFAIWAFKAKVVLLQPLRPVPAAFTDPGLSYSHQDYPLGFPLLVAGAYAAVGGAIVTAGKLVLPAVYLSLLGIVYAGVRRYHRRGIAVAVAAATIAAPTLSHNAQVSVAETPLLMMFAAAASLLVRWVEDGERGDLLLAGGFAAAAAFTKNEGLGILPVYGVASLIVVVSSPAPARRRRLLDWAVAVAVAAVVIGPWLAYRHGLPKTHEDYGSKLTGGATLIGGLHRLPSVAAAFLRHPLRVPQAGLVWYVLIASAAFGWRAFAGAPARLLWGLLVAQLALYTTTLAVTPWDPGVLIPMIGNKLAAQASPVVALLIAIHLRAAGFVDRQNGADTRPGFPVGRATRG